MTSAIGSAASSISVAKIFLPASASDKVAAVGEHALPDVSLGGLCVRGSGGGGGALGDQGFFLVRGTLALAALAKDAQNLPELGRTSFRPGSGAAGSGWLNLSVRRVGGEISRRRGVCGTQALAHGTLPNKLR